MPTDVSFTWHLVFREGDTADVDRDRSGDMDKYKHQKLGSDGYNPPASWMQNDRSPSLSEGRGR